MRPSNLFFLWGRGGGGRMNMNACRAAKRHTYALPVLTKKLELAHPFFFFFNRFFQLCKYQSKKILMIFQKWAV